MTRLHCVLGYFQLSSAVPAGLVLQEPIPQHCEVLGYCQPSLWDPRQAGAG
jgi:hypothetical protein